jgi:dipeptidase
MFSPSIKNDVTKNTFPIYTVAEKPMTISDFRKAFRYHYDNTEHDPYLHSNGKEPYRPVGIFRTTQTHLLQVRPNLPKEIGCVSYVAMGMSDLGVFLPLYQGVKSYPATYKMGNSHSDNQSAYWKFRKVMTLGMVNYNAYAPIIKEAYAKLEAENDQRQKEMEKEYLKLYKDEPIKANEMLQQFSDSILNKAECVAESLIEEIFTRLTLDIQKEYMFHGA